MRECRIVFLFSVLIMLFVCLIPTADTLEQVVVSEVVPEVYVSQIDDYKSEYNNEDIVAELKIDGIGLDTVVTKGNNNDYYLNHDAFKNESIFGNPYVDFRNEFPLDEERQINIYSHNFKGDKYDDLLPFSKLESYLNEQVFSDSSDVNLFIADKAIKYEVYAVKIITTDNEHTIIDSSSDERWQHHLDNLLSDTLYCKDDCHLSSNEKILVMQTCNYNPEGSFLLVIARKIK